MSCNNSVKEARMRRVVGNVIKLAWTIAVFIGGVWLLYYLFTHL